MGGKLTEAQEKAIELLSRTCGLDYQVELYSFAVPGAERSERIQMVTAKSLIAAGLVKATRTKQMRGRDVPDRIELA